MLSGTPEEEVARLAGWLRQDFRARKIVALGEIGLDYYEGHALPPDPARQQRFFELQLELAEQLDLPVILHDREAHGDLMEILLRHPRVRGVLHSFSGSPEMAQDLVRRGWYVSFSGVLTYRNARKTVETALQVDRSRVLLETDCPYLAPVPYRGRTNHSGRMEATALRLAELWGVDGEEVARVTFRNGCRLFGLPETVRPSD
jgi:TatD DNase family protein